jgi:hypothetical protein
VRRCWELFPPRRNTAAAVARFKATVESLKDMQKPGWVELERSVGQTPIDVKPTWEYIRDVRYELLCH